MKQVNKELFVGEFEISLKDARRIVDGLELAATWDKTKIYYELKDWIDREDKTGRYAPVLED